MKELKAYVRPLRLEYIIGELEKSGAKDITVIRVEAIGEMADSEWFKHRLIRKYREKYSAISKVEIVCADEDAYRFAEVIRQQGRTGEAGDGRVFISDIDYALDVRTGKEGEDAL